MLVALSVALALMAWAAIAGSTWLPFLRIHSVDVVGTKTVQPQDVVSAAQSQLYGGYLHLFARSNILLYPKDAIKQRLLTQFPMFQSVDVHAEHFNTLGVTVVERQPVALWCGLSVATSSSCFLVDQGGIVYAPAVVYSGDAYQRFYGSVMGDALPQQFLEASQFHSLTTLVGALEQKLGSRAQSIVVDSDHDVHVAFGNSFGLIFALDTASGDVFDRLGLALASDVFTAHPLTDFEYLDLRFGDKLYYRLRSAAPAPKTATSTATSTVTSTVHT